MKDKVRIVILIILKLLAILIILGLISIFVSAYIMMREYNHYDSNIMQSYEDRKITEKDFDRLKSAMSIKLMDVSLNTSTNTSEESTIEKDGIVVNNNKEAIEKVLEEYNLNVGSIDLENTNLTKLNSNKIYVRLLNIDESSFDIFEIKDVKITKYTSKEKVIYDVAYLVDLNMETFDKKHDKEKKLVIVPFKTEDTNKKIEWNVTTEYYTDRYINFNNADDVAKPVIYIYPEQEMKLEVMLGKEENITCIYPEYNNGWKVLAKPDGTLVNLETGREYYSLYYESKNTKDYDEYEIKDGFVVSKDDITKFLEEKLSILGLNDREAEEFIIYWLPKLQSYPYVYIRFQTAEEINNNMPLKFSKEPDTLIRVIMEWEGLENPITIQNQTLNQIDRKGFTIVEWGGTEIVK